MYINPLPAKNEILPAIPVTVRCTGIFCTCNKTTNKPGYILNADNYVNNDTDI